MRLSIFVTIVLTLTAGVASGGPLKAADILRRAQAKISTPEETASIKLKITEADGSSKTRCLVVKRKSGAKNFVLARLEGNSDLTGTAFLSVYDKGKEEQWLYLPSSKQTRRILGGNKQAGFLGSEISYEDLSASETRGARVYWIRTDSIGGHKYAVIEVRAKRGNSSYSRVRSWISLDQYLVLRAEYYDWHNKLMKLVNFFNYRRYGYDVWRAGLVRVRNVQNRRGTDLILQKLDVGQKISDSEFSVQSLEVD